MTADIDDRLRADGEHWRGAQASRASISLQTALAAAVPERDTNETAILELAPAPPPRRPATRRRWVLAAVAAVVVVLAGTAAAVIGTSRHSDRHATGTTAAAVSRRNQLAGARRRHQRKRHHPELRPSCEKADHRRRVHTARTTSSSDAAPCGSAA